MKLPSYVKPFPRFRLLTNNAEYGFVSFSGKSIYLNPQIYTDLLNENPKPFSIGILMHEEYHREDLKKVGPIKYLFKNTFIPRFRLLHEVAAYKEEFTYLKKHNTSIDLDKIARDFSGLKYFHVTNYINAKRLLDKAWEEA